MRRELFEEGRGRLIQQRGLAALHGHIHMEIDLTSDQVAIESVSTCLSGLSILFEGLDAYETATQDRHA